MEHQIEFFELKNNYIQDVLEKIGLIESLISETDTLEGSFDKDKLNEILGIIHSIKGTSGSFNLDGVSSICHHLEDKIGAFRQEEEKEFVDQILFYIDHLREALECYQSGKQYKLDNFFLKLYGKDESQIDKIRVLLVDSSQTLRKKLVFDLSNKGYSVASSETGYEALGRLLYENFDYVVISSRTSKLDALPLIFALRNSGCVNKNINIIVITSSANIQIPTEIKKIDVVRKDLNLIENIDKQIKSHEKSKIEEVIEANQCLSVIYLDDDEFLTQLVDISYNNSKTMNVKSYNKAETFLADLEKHYYDVVLLDGQMPNIDVGNLVAKVQNTKNCKSVVFYTGDDDSANDNRLIKYGANGVIHKPLIPKKIEAKIREIIQESVG